jgi:hypothetical protein
MALWAATIWHSERLTAESNMKGNGRENKAKERKIRTII